MTKKPTSTTNAESDRRPRIEAERTPALEWLRGQRVQRIDGPDPKLFVLTLYQRGEKLSLLLMVGPERLGVASSPQRPTGAAASAFVKRLRNAFENARLKGAQWLHDGAHRERALALELELERNETVGYLALELDPRHPNLYLLDAERRVVGAADEGLRRKRFPSRGEVFSPGLSRGISPPASAQALAELGSAIGTGDEVSRDTSARHALRDLARKAERKLERRVQAIQGDLARLDELPKLRAEGNAILMQLSNIPRGARELRVPAGEARDEELVIALDPSVSAQSNAQRRFDRARRLARGQAVSEARLAMSRTELEAIRALLATLDSVPVDQLEAAAHGAGLRRAPQASAPGFKPVAPVRTPYRSFTSSGGHRILVGKSAADNDALTSTVARPHDVWLHARGITGSHVVIMLNRGADLPADVLVDAATLAAHFSAARGEPLTEVQYAERRYIRKPKGSAPGAVQVDREKVLVLRLESDRLQRLLASELTR